MIFSLFGVAERFYGRCSRAQKYFCIVQFSEYNGGVAGVVTRWGVVLFKRCFVLFVYDHQTEVGKRQKYRTTRSYNDPEFVGVIGQHVVPDLNAFVLIETAVIDANEVAKVMLQAPNKLGGECNFRNQKQHLFA